MSKEAIKLALEVLRGIHVGNMTPMAEEYWNKAIKVLEEALAKQEQGEWVGLTDEERYEIANVPRWSSGAFVEATEAKLKEKNGG